jgi:hypothetical protein
MQYSDVSVVFSTAGKHIGDVRRTGAARKKKRKKKKEQKNSTAAA